MTSFCTRPSGSSSRTTAARPGTGCASFVSGVDPTNADRVYVRSTGKETGRLLVSDDAGASFRAVFEARSMLGFALSADGRKVFVGTPEGGLPMANTSDFVFRTQSTTRVRCLATSGTTLYACADDSAGFAVGASEDDGRTDVCAPQARLPTSPPRAA